MGVVGIRLVFSVAVIWLITGLIFHFSRGWLWVLSTGTSILTLLMLFLILNTRSRHTRSISHKLDQLERVLRKLHSSHHNRGNGDMRS
jgi:low affinity Fe/Cu permease